MDENGFQLGLVAKAWFGFEGIAPAAALPAFISAELLEEDLEGGQDDGLAAVEFSHIENYVTNATFRRLVGEARRKGATAFVRRCACCGKLLHVMLVASGYDESGVAVVCTGGRFCGYATVDEKTRYELWLCMKNGKLAA